MKQKTKLALAVTAALGASVPAVQAVNIAEDGLGEVGLYSYYTARGTYDTNIGVINTSDETVLVKVRFREYYNSRDVRDFLVVLSPYDMWQAVVTRNAANTAARVATADRSCTVPISIRDGGPGATFTNQLFDDGGPTSLERTKEGHIEIINMGNSRCEDGSCEVAFWGTHTGPHGGREPRDCNFVEQQFTATNIAATQLDFDEPENVLKFSADIINVANGTAFSYDPVTLANFFNPLDPPLGTYTDAECEVGLYGTVCNLVNQPAFTIPQLNDVNPRISSIHTQTAGVSLTSTWDGVSPNIPVDAVSALFMRTSLINQFRTAPGIGDTDFVVTLPTKNFYVDKPFPPIDPFPQVFGENNDAQVIGTSRDRAGACFDVVYTPTDTEETRVDDPEGVPPSPPPPEGQNARICREANVIEINDEEGESGVLDGSPAYHVATGFDAGWLNINLQPPAQGAADLIATNIISDEGHVYNGVPVTGFAVTELNNLNPAVPGGSTTYGKLWDHAYRRNIISQ